MINSTTSTVDGQQNLGLKFADWRFLLPSQGDMFQHLCMLGGSEDFPQSLIESGIARQVSVIPPVNKSADVIVALSDAQVDLKDIAASLAPGGALYFEVDRRSPAHFATTPKQIQRRLREVGLSPIGVYWAAPDFANRRRYIPLDIPEAFRWYLSSLFVAGTASFRLLEAAIRLFTGSQSHRFASIAPCFAVTAVAGTVQGDAAPSVLGHSGLPPELKVPGQRPVILTSGQTRAVILPFVSGVSEPLAVVKVSRHADFNTHTEQEQAVLTEIRDQLHEDMLCTIPRPMGLLQYGELKFGIESFVRGSPLMVTSGRWRTPFKQKIDDLRMAANWLCKFHRQVNRGRVTWQEATIERWIEQRLTAYRQSFGLTSSEKRLFTEVRRRAASLLDTSFPVIWMHYDFGPWNLYRDGTEFSVIDWEFGKYWERERFGPALYDLLFFATHWAHVVRQLHSESAQLRGFYELFIQKSSVDEYVCTARQAITDYMAALNIDRRFLPLLLVYMWIDQSLVKVTRSQVLGETLAAPRVGNRGVRHIEIMAKHVEQFFDGW